MALAVPLRGSRFLVRRGSAFFVRRIRAHFFYGFEHFDSEFDRAVFAAMQQRCSVVEFVFVVSRSAGFDVHGRPCRDWISIYQDCYGYHKFMLVSHPPNQSPEPTVVGAFCLSASDLLLFIDSVPRWLSFFR